MTEQIQQIHPGGADAEALSKFLSDFGSTAVAPYALVRRGKVMCFFSDAATATESGTRAYADQAFSVFDIHTRNAVRRP
jgi:hypothetical protein